MKKYIYLDNSAATRLDERVLEAMKPYLFETYAVATSEFGYSLGIAAREALENSRNSIASRLGCNSDEFIFTSGSTESSNIAIKGVIRAADPKKRKIIISAIEDFPILHSAKALEKDGFTIIYIDVDKNGILNLNELDNSITEDTCLVSIQHANQEIGTIQKIKEIGNICKKRGVLFHTDATHTFPRVPLNVDEYGIDLATISAHTIHGPRAVGGLYIRKGTKISKLFEGGFQEFDLRPGIENIAGAVGFAKAVELITDDETMRIKEMRDLLISEIEDTIPEVTLNGDRTIRTPQNANLTFHRVEGESITLHLDLRGFAVSTGSACFSRSLEASHVILGIGGDHERAHGSIRFSFGRFNNKDEIYLLVKELKEIISELRRITPLGNPNLNL